MIRLFIRLYFGITIAVVVSLVLAAILLDQQYQKTLGQDSLIHSRALHDHMQKELATLPPESWPQKIKQSQDRYAYYIDVIPLDSLTKAIRQQLESSSVSVTVNSGIVEDEIVLYYKLDNTPQAIRYTAKALSQIEYNWILLGYLGVLMAMLATVIFLLAKPVANHIYSLAKVSEQIGDGHLDTHANEKGPYPLNHLAKTINQMSARLKQLIKEQEVMTGAVSHELRTPMANLRFALDMTRKLENVSVLREHIEEMDQDINAMESLVDELLTFARVNQPANTVKPERILVNQEITSAIQKVSQFRPDIKIQVDADDSIEHVLFARDFNRVIINLLTNAQKYATQIIHITSIKQNEELVIYIDDDGPGIPESAREDIFIPFKRLEQSRSKESGGYGLGLAIVERIMQKHRGHISAGESPFGGARLTLNFPELQLEGI